MVCTRTKNSSANWAAVLTLALFLYPLAMAGQSVTLAWNPSPSPGVAGYLVFCGTNGTDFDSQIDVGSNTTVTVTELQPGSTNYFEVVAYDTNFVESPPSNLLRYSVPAATQTLTVTPNSASAGTVAGGGIFPTGSPVTVTATANSGYAFANWTENGIIQSTSPSYTLTLDSSCNLVANFTVIPASWTVTAQASPTIAGSVTGAGTFSPGSSVTVSATANNGYTFANWTENGIVQSTSPGYSFTLTTNRNLVANFTVNQVLCTVATQASPATGGTVAGAGTFNTGTFITVTATAKSGYTFTNWTANGIVQSTTPSYAFTVTNSVNLVANFTVIPVNYTVATQVTPANAGTVTGGGTLLSGSPVTVTASANSGYIFANWTENGIVQSASVNYSFTLATNRNLVANFTPVYTVATQIYPVNAGTVSGGGTFTTGASVTVIATANNGYTFTNWTENGIVQSASPNYVFTIATNRNLVANFTVNPTTYAVATQANPANAGSVFGGGTFISGTSVTVTAAANSGYTFTNWTENGIVQGTSLNYSFTLITNRNLMANFTASPVTYSVATQIYPVNAGSVTGGGTFVTGSSVTVMATANSGYTFTNWTENGIAQSASPNYAFTLATNRNLVANFTVNPTTYTVATQNSPDNGGVVTGGGTFAAGSSITVIATANSGYTFTNWTENGIVQSISPNYGFTLTTNRNLVANYTINAVAYTLAAQVSPANAGNVTGGGTYASGSSVTVAATANSGYSFTNWTLNGIVQSASPSYTLILTTNYNLVANFAVAPITYTVAAQASPANAGSVSGGGTFASGSSVTVLATANGGYTFNNWTENGIVQSASASYGFTLATNRNLVANFVPVSYTVATQVNPSAAGNVSGGGTFSVGTSVTVTAAANSGYTFTNWTENGIAQGASLNYTFTLATNRNLVANFTANPITYSVATQIYPVNAGSVSGGGTFSAGTSVTVTATANSGYIFTNWTANGIVQSTSASYTFALTTNCNLVANFTAIASTFSVATQVSPANAGSVSGGGSFSSGTFVTVTATANSGFTFTNWTENGIVQSTSLGYGFTVATNCNLVANFIVSPVTYTVAPLVSPVNAGNVTGGGTFVTGSSVTVTATANSGYTFTNWTQNGIAQSTSPNYTFTLTANSSLVANFTATPVTYTVATQITPADAGIVTGAGTFLTGSQATVTATANNGYTFTNWTENGIVQSTFPTYSFTLTTNRNLVANFTVNPVMYTVQSQISPINAGIVTGDGTFAPGTSVTVTAIANSAYAFTNWTENGVVQSTSSNYSFTLATNRNLVANFAVNSITYTVTPISGTNGSITPVGPQTVSRGSNVSFYVTPIGNYQVNQWLFNGVAVQNGGTSYTLQNVTANSTVNVSFSVKQSNFVLLTSGDGTLSPNLKTFKEGERYTVTAIPANGSVFADWTSNGIVVTTAPRYTFLVESNLVLQANFVINPFTAIAGNFDGLFYDTNNATEDSSGSITASVTKSGTYTARISQAGLSYSFSGQLSVAGTVSKSIPRPRSSPLTVQLQLGSHGSPMTGTISDGVWMANLEADPAIYSANNRSPQAGRYTLLIPGSSAASTQPGGNGFGTVTVGETGIASLSGTLGDGTPVISSSVVCSGGQWPLYVSLYGGKGSLLGWLSFTNYGVIGGQIAWFKLPQKTAKFYSSGFTNTTEVIGSSYKYTAGFPVLGYSYGSLSLINGNLSERINDQIGIWPGVLSFNQNGSKLMFNSVSGQFSGTVTNPQTGKPITVNGVVLQYQDFAGGLFLGTNQTGSVVLSRGE